MKKMWTGLICSILIVVTSLYSGKISSFIKEKVSDNRIAVVPNANKYAKDYDFAFVKLDKDYIPYSYNDLINVFFTILNSGATKATFYCPNEYKNCITDVEKISNDALILTHVNNFIHPYNNFTNIETTIYESGEITLNISHVYNIQKIEEINKAVDDIINKLYDEEKSDYENIKSIHDYIINNTKYDQEHKEDNNKYESNNAYGVIKSNLATCNGYTDLMAIILSKLNIKNYKIATTPERISYESLGHVWNAVYLDNEWVHLDLTWDDPVSESGEDYLYHKYFLVSNEEIAEADFGEVVVEEHNFDDAIYLEFNDSIKEVISQ